MQAMSFFSPLPVGVVLPRLLECLRQQNNAVLVQVM